LKSFERIGSDSNLTWGRVVFDVLLKVANLSSNEM